MMSFSVIIAGCREVVRDQIRILQKESICLPLPIKVTVVLYGPYLLTNEANVKE
jgi:hypothetical protein